MLYRVPRKKTGGFKVYMTSQLVLLAGNSTWIRLRSEGSCFEELLFWAYILLWSIMCCLENLTWTASNPHTVSGSIHLTSNTRIGWVTAPDDAICRLNCRGHANTFARACRQSSIDATFEPWGAFQYISYSVGLSYPARPHYPFPPWQYWARSDCVRIVDS